LSKIQVECGQLDVSIASLSLHGEEDEDEWEVPRLPDWDTPLEPIPFHIEGMYRENKERVNAEGSLHFSDVQQRFRLIL